MNGNASSQNLPTKMTPASLNYQMPAEWEPHEAMWLAWPHNEETWPGKKMARVEETYLQMLEGLLPNEKVNLLVASKMSGDKIKDRLKKMGISTKNLMFHPVPTADVWIRDYGPTFLKKQTGDSEKAWIKWIFNAWGGKYEPLMRDTQVFSLDASQKTHPLIPYPCFEANMVLEGGSIEVNGQGTCLTTEQCLLNKNRNPQLSRAQIENDLREYLGVSHIVWLKEGIVGDDTDGHIDDIARFVNPGTIVATHESDSRDPNHEILKHNWETLQKSEDQEGRKWILVKLPMPGVVVEGRGRLPASYANFLIANGVVLLPIFGHANDKEAIKILQDLFPHREILPIRCNDLVCGLGTIHCVSQQEPL